VSRDVIVLGGGIVGVATAIHLAKRGRSVLLVDKREPGRETSFGNAGIIQREGVRPRTFPRDIATLARIARNRSTDARYSVSVLPELSGPLLQYWLESEPERYRKIVADYAPLIARSIDTHAELIAEAGAEDLIVKQGWISAFRSQHVLEREVAAAEGDRRDYGVNFAALDGAALKAAEPNIQIEMAGAIHWTDPWTVKDPGALVSAYAELFTRLGGTIAVGDAATLEQWQTGWSVKTDDGIETARDVVIALGAWSREAVAKLGYSLPLFVKRGYHMHYGDKDGTVLNHCMLDAEGGYMLAPMRKGIRITTGAEFSPRDAEPSPVQLERAERTARKLLPLGARVDPQPWMGSRPCTPDMKPIIGAAPRHSNLWFGFGHAHHGFTLGPVTGKLIAQAMTGETPEVALAPFSAARFL